MGENTITNIMKVSVAGTSLKESEKKVYESQCKKNNREESKDCKFRIYRQCNRAQRYQQFPTSQQLGVHSPSNGSVERKQIAPCSFSGCKSQNFLHESSCDGVLGTDNDEQSLNNSARVLSFAARSVLLISKTAVYFL